ncbi:MAG: hypothetical protein IKE55_09395 [Kiritimatiellae bacterium]|nr:hypothetical protein [Kiritimatiellia bacterium]
MRGDTIDIEAALVEALGAAGVGASAPPVPATLGAALPWAHVTRTGGSEAAYVQDVHRVDIDVYGSTEAAAAQAAGRLCGLVRSLAGSALGGVPCYSASIETLPYSNPDPRHPTLPRVTLKAQITTRTA